MRMANTEYSRQKVVELVTSWLGKNEKDGSYKQIIDIYNGFKGTLPRKIKMQYNWAWCACTWSALAIELGYTDIMPIEISCGKLIEQAKSMGCWVENDGYIPSPGDAILYDWDDNGVGDNVGWPDHIGTITFVYKESGYMEVVEGNYDDSVKKRTISLNGRYIRGFITPKYTIHSISQIPIEKDMKELVHEIILGKWGSGEDRKIRLTEAGYDYNSVQAMVNQTLNGSAVISKNPVQDQDQPVSKKITASCSAKRFLKDLAGTFVTTADLYCRNDAGTNKKALCLIPKGTKVKNYGYYNLNNTAIWPYIQFIMDGVQYTGFSSIKYLDYIGK